ncbi:MAG: S53 family peptidase [Candidatus Dormibacteraceae bacterium]
MATSWIQVSGSEPPRPAGAQRVAGADPDQQVSVTVTVNGRDQEGLAATLRLLDETPPAERRYLTREELARRHGADPSDLERVASFYREQGLEVVEQSIARRCVVVRGNVRALGAAFQVSFGSYRHPGGTYRGLDGAYAVPADLADVITSVLGLDGRPQAEARHVVGSGAAGAAFPPAQVGEIYAFPAGASGASACVGILELGGGYTTSDLDAFFEQAKLPAPAITTVPVDGASNSPSGGTGADVEVALDIEVVGAVHPGAAIAVYFAPNTDQGFYDAVTTAIHDQSNQPAILSISWGGAESTWTAQAMDQMEQAFGDAAAVGITVTVASGDSGSADGVADGRAHVDFPASAPHALGCGGTQLTASGTTWKDDQVWNGGGGATGGGVSVQFPLPSYQASAGVPVSANPGGKAGRGVPDVAGDADPDTGYSIYVGGTAQAVGGTSAVAPLWAGLAALLGEALGKPLGFVNPQLYPLIGSTSFHQVLSGSNGAYQAGPGWNACCGLGTPDGANLLAALS